MPNGSVNLKPGVDVEQTPTLNEAGISQSQLIRTKNGITQTIGGWAAYGLGLTIPSTVRDMHAWLDTRGTAYLSAAATSNVPVLTSTTYRDIVPLSRTSSI